MKIKFEVSKDKEEALQILKRSAGLCTYNDLFNNALSLFEWAIKEVQKGHSIASVDEAGASYRELRMPILKIASAVKPPQPSTS